MVVSVPSFCSQHLLTKSHFQMNILRWPHIINGNCLLLDRDLWQINHNPQLWLASSSDHNNICSFPSKKWEGGSMGVTKVIPNYKMSKGKAGAYADKHQQNPTVETALTFLRNHSLWYVVNATIYKTLLNLSILFFQLSRNQSSIWLF